MRLLWSRLGAAAPLLKFITEVRLRGLQCYAVRHLDDERLAVSYAHLLKNLVHMELNRSAGRS